MDRPGIPSYAGFWKRFAAAIVDWVITYIGGFVIGFLIGFGYGLQGGSSEEAEIVGFIIGALLGWIYYAAMESSLKQATLGKIILGIKVTDLGGHRISFSKASGRFWGKIVSLLTVGIGFLMIGFTEKKQGLHDLMSGCLVVNKH